MGRYQPFYDHAQRGARRSCGCRYRSGRERHPRRRSARGDGRFHRAGLIHRRRPAGNATVAIDEFDFGPAFVMGQFANEFLEQIAPR